MTTVDITLGISQTKSNSIGDVPIIKYTQLYLTSFIYLSAYINYSGADYHIEYAELAVRKTMTSDIDIILEEANKEISNAKKLIKNKYPIRNRIKIIKVFIKNPKLFLYAYNKTHAN